MSGAVNTRITSTSAQILQGGGKVTADGLELGGYEGGVVLSWNQTEKFIKSDHQMGEVDSEIDMVEVTVETQLEEATLENVAIAYGIHSSSVLSGASSKVLNLTPSASMREVALVFEGMSATNRNKVRTVTLTKVIRIGQSQTTFHRGVKTVVPVRFKALMTSGSFGTMVDATV